MIALSHMPRPLNILGVKVVPFDSYAQALESVEDVVVSGGKSFWMAVNPQKVYRAWNDADVLDVMNRADVGICDGVGVSLAARILQGVSIRRCTGCDLFFRLVARAAEKGWRVFLLGASPESNRGAAEKLQAQYPGLKIVGAVDGYFRDGDEVVRQVNESGAELLFVAMGSPRQEFWIRDHLAKLNVCFCMGVGGSFDVAAGEVRRAPLFFQKTGTEFLFQLFIQPARWRRQIVYFPFMLRVLEQKFFGLRRVGIKSIVSRERESCPAAARRQS
jgi:N-acetylglucosaminyldiphosphoundecaprenol N-acetyl-beta-D-mannosaminyltransferase